MLTLLKHQTVYLDDIEYLVISGSADTETLLERKDTGERIKVSTYSLVEKYLTGQFKTAAMRRAQLKYPQNPNRPPARMDKLSESAKKETRRRIDYLVRLDNQGAFGMSRKGLRAEVARVAAERKEFRPPCVSTVYRWRRKYRESRNDVRALFARFDCQGGKGQGRLAPEVEGFIDDAIDQIALQQKRFSGGEIRNAVGLAVDRANLTRDKDHQLKTPSLRTIFRRIRLIEGYELTRARTGQAEADRRFKTHGTARAVQRLLELVEIDHSPVDIYETDSKGVSNARPTITVVLERKSRCVLGYHLSAAGHGVPAVFAALRHALLPKLYLRGKYADLNLEWPCFGWFERVLMDNGREFHADAVADALLNLGIGCEFAASRAPNDKPHVERFLRTFNYGLIHKLKGTTLDKAHKRIGFKSEDEAVLTLEELDRAIHVWICNVYHLRPHRGLEGRTPLAVWEEGAQVFPPQLKMNEEDIDIEFGDVTESKVQHYGIDLNTFKYDSPRLQTLRAMGPIGMKIDVKVPFHDVGHVWAWDTVANEYFKLMNRQPEYAGLTLDQAKVVRQAKADGDPRYLGSPATGEAIIRDMVETAYADKKLAKRREGARLANETSTRARQASAQAAEEPVDEDPPDEMVPATTRVPVAPINVYLPDDEEV